MSERDEQSTEGNLATRWSFHEFLVDFLGGLVPGILFTVATVFVVTPSARALISATATPPENPGIGKSIREFLEASKDTPSMIWIAAFVFALLLSYVLGHIFYRRDPKEPDKASFALLYDKRPRDSELTELYGSEKDFRDRDNNEDKLTREEDWLRKNLACENAEECEFPYPHLADYLEQRGHKHLLPLVRWAEEPNWRTKTYINQLKIRLNFYFPENYRRIIRNEAHVRLATSTWYLVRTLKWISVIGLTLIGVGFLFTLVRGGFSTPWDALAWSFPPLVAPVTVFWIAQFSKLSCEQFIHYQRLREVYYVLELAFTAFRDHPDRLGLTKPLVSPKQKK